jgi:hypothetical protein
VALANDCPFGLGSAVWSRNPKRARAVGARIEVQCPLLRCQQPKVQVTSTGMAHYFAAWHAGGDDQHQRLCDDVHVPVAAVWRREALRLRPLCWHRGVARHDRAQSSGRGQVSLEEEALRMPFKLQSWRLAGNLGAYAQSHQSQLM